MRRRPPRSTLFPYTTLFPIFRKHQHGGVLRLRERRTRRAGYELRQVDRKSTRLNSSHMSISYAVFCLKKKNRGLLFVAQVILTYTVQSTGSALSYPAPDSGHD